MSGLNMSEITSVVPYLFPAEANAIHPCRARKPSLTTLVPLIYLDYEFKYTVASYTVHASLGLRSICSTVQVMSAGPCTACHMYVF